MQDFGRGIPVDYNKNEEKYNWELLFCEMYAGGKYDNDGENYEFSLGLNGLGLCATQYASEYMDAEVHTGGYKYTLLKRAKMSAVLLKKNMTSVTREHVYAGSLI